MHFLTSGEDFVDTLYESDIFLNSNWYLQAHQQ